MHATRYAVHPQDFKTYSTDRIRENFLIENLFSRDQINTVYSHSDRLIIGGVQPETTSLRLLPTPDLKADFFLQRRELGIINVGSAAGDVLVEGERHTLQPKEALYVGRGVKDVAFNPAENGKSLFYFNSAPAHVAYPSRKISLQQAETVELGSIENSNHRTIRKLLVNSVIETCQLQMGLTELKKGSVWNTMPPHTHDRRMEAYFYFDLPENQMVCHFMGQPDETRHLWVKNNEAVISPPWSVHCGAGTGSYSFIWGMAGENLDYSDMDVVPPATLR